MERKIICDICKKPIEEIKDIYYYLDMGKARQIDKSNEYKFELEVLSRLALCQRCWLGIEREINRRKRINEVQEK